MPKQRITKEMVVNAAFSLARAQGMAAVTVKALAKSLGCSVQPIYSYCESMEGLRKAVAEKARAFVQEAIAQGLAAGEPKSALAKRLAKSFSLPKAQVYDKILQLG